VTDLTARKRAIRTEVFARRKIAHAADRGYGTTNLLSVLNQHRGKTIAGYMPIRTEINPLPAMTESALHGPVCVPVIQGAAMPLKFSRWTPDTPLRDGPFGAKVPAVDDFLSPDIIIVPLVAFDDETGARLGYGGGFYDRTLEELSTQKPILAIGFAYQTQFEPELPQELTDYALDMVVTEKTIQVI
jgi:5-formyltetrahydrofolate cyclo-ligase